MADWLERFARNVFLAIAVGLGTALFLSAYVVILVAVGGGGVLEEYDVSLATVVGIYFAGGLAGGAIIGALLPLGRRWYGAILLGYLGALPLYGMVGMATWPASQWLTDIPPFLVYVAGPIGAVLGLMVWIKLRREGEI
jgi:hypothetical protein